MPAITALLHTHNDEMRLGRALETLYPCDQIVIVDHNSHDDTLRVARQYGARILSGDGSLSSERWSNPLEGVESGWILCLAPTESLSEALAASLYELKLLPEDSVRAAYSVRLREETYQTWMDRPPETRLVPQSWRRWTGIVPEFDPAAAVLEGELLRFTFP